VKLLRPNLVLARKIRSNTLQPYLLVQLWTQISLRRKKQFVFLLILMLATSFAEVFSLGAVLPFLGALTSPEKVFSYALMQPFFEIFDIFSPTQLLFPLTLIFILAALIAGAMRLILLWASTKLAFATGADLSIEIYKRTLYQPYSVHCSRNSSEIMNGILSKTNNTIYSVIVPTLKFITSAFILILIVIAMLFIEPLITIYAFIGFGSIYTFIILLTRNKQLRDSHLIAKASSYVIKSLQEGLGGIRDVLLDNNQKIYCETYHNADLSLRRAQGDNMFISQSPRFAMEALGMVLIALLAYFLAQKASEVSKIVPTLGLLALGAQRLLPLLQQAYSSFSDIRVSRISLFDVLSLLKQPLPNYAHLPKPKPLVFKEKIHVKSIRFQFDKNLPYVLNDINFVIPKGSRLGFIGETGSGKSTMLDIIMGLLDPTEGVVEVDGKVITKKNKRFWQANIAHVPQNIFLTDSTIEENIAFGIPPNEIDHKEVIKAAKQAQIYNDIESWPKKLKTLVGERGIRLSGGQRQRIGIARALYKKANVIIFDEATSSLDVKTERSVMNSIEKLNKNLTLLIIAHRITTLKNCNQIIEIEKGMIKRKGSYKDIIKETINK
jgi:ABC-type multidrug transport system fused ATPase/permease subunit